MKKLVWLLATAVALTAGAAFAADGDISAPVPGDTGVAGPLTSIGAPAAGSYSFLAHGYINSYARVTVYDNEIAFSAAEMTPDLGSTKVNGTWVRAIAAGADKAPYTNPVAVPGATGYNVAGARVETNCRLDMSVDMIGHMKRVQNDGTPFLGKDTRRADVGDYELATQYKIVFKGLYFGYTNGQSAVDPAEDAYLGDGTLTAFVSPTSTQDTFYAPNPTGSDYTDWDKSGNAPGDITANDGWLWPDTAATDMFPWSGTTYTAYDTVNGAANANPANQGYSHVKDYTLVIERGQAEPNFFGSTNYKSAAEFWFSMAVIRRGLQDVMGNYKVEPIITIMYRENDGQWNPA